MALPVVQFLIALIWGYLRLLFQHFPNGEYPRDSLDLATIE